MSGPAGDTADKALSQRDGLQQGKNDQKKSLHKLVETKLSSYSSLILEASRVASVGRIDIAFRLQMALRMNGLCYLLKHVQKLLPRIHRGVFFVADVNRMCY